MSWSGESLAYHAAGHEPDRDAHRYRGSSARSSGRAFPQNAREPARRTPPKEPAERLGWLFAIKNLLAESGPQSTTSRGTSNSSSSAALPKPVARVSTTCGPAGPAKRRRGATRKSDT
jgi:hypothetical protein